MTKKNRRGAARAARAAQQAGTDMPYTELLRAADTQIHPAVEPDPAPALAPTATPAGGLRMLKPWSSTTLVRIDSAYDQEMADRAGGSRFAAYVQQNRKSFAPWDDEDPDPVEFAVTAWRTATGPVMSPGYVRLRPDLHRVRAGRDDYAGDLAITIEVPLRHHHLAADRLPYGWADWQAARYQRGEDRYPALEEPETHQSTVAVLTTSTVQILARGWPLPSPTLADIQGTGLIAHAREAVDVLVDGINDHGGPVVACLLGQD
ncbi:hypothetical protein [Streptomyces sp. NRRL S-350]|uniref:hypothetical protein n=1 Tax=Streptomyces sp. NRRL S-350 TaxID=1463902 RepID=UPI0006893D82|nr:hypothetical protein [Streptomyces sp. NRRL S-350]